MYLQEHTQILIREICTIFSRWKNNKIGMSTIYTKEKEICYDLLPVQNFWQLISDPWTADSWQLTSDSWYLTPGQLTADSWHLTSDSWYLTPRIADIWQLTSDIWPLWQLTADSWPLWLLLRRRKCCGMLPSYSCVLWCHQTNMGDPNTCI